MLVTGLVTDSSTSATVEAGVLARSQSAAALAAGEVADDARLGWLSQLLVIAIVLLDSSLDHHFLLAAQLIDKVINSSNPQLQSFPFYLQKSNNRTESTSLYDLIALPHTMQM